jgi:hypothetical protein
MKIVFRDNKPHKLYTITDLAHAIGIDHQLAGARVYRVKTLPVPGTARAQDVLSGSKFCPDCGNVHGTGTCLERNLQ